MFHSCVVGCPEWPRQCTHPAACVSPCARRAQLSVDPGKYDQTLPEKDADTGRSCFASEAPRSPGQKRRTALPALRPEQVGLFTELCDSCVQARSRQHRNAEAQATINTSESSGELDQSWLYKESLPDLRSAMCVVITNLNDPKQPEH